MMHQFISDHWTSESSFPGCLRAYVARVSSSL